MSKRNNNSKVNASTGNKNDSHDKSARQIRQVYIDENNEINEKKSQTDEVEVISIDKEENKSEIKEEQLKVEKSESENKHIHTEDSENPVKTSSKGKTIRIAAIAAALVFSLLLSMCVGGGLALWDSEKTVADLNEALFNKDVYAAASVASDASEVISNLDEDADENNSAEEVSEDELAGESTIDESIGKTQYTDDEQNDEVIETAEEPTEESVDETADATGEIAGLETLTKAGSNDEIVLSETPIVSGYGGNPNINYPLPFTIVDESYFTDALFIGDSRLQGFGMWSSLPATYYCATGFSIFKYETTNVVQTENGKVPIFDALPYDAFTKIYIKVGLNEMGWDNEKQFEAKYVELIQKLREYEPHAIIYIHGILPVTAAKSASDKAHNNTNIIARNEKLKELATSQQAYYIDAGPALSDENGCLRPEMTSDGIHLASQYMTLWKQYLCEHAIVVR